MRSRFTPAGPSVNISARVILILVSLVLAASFAYAFRNLQEGDTAPDFQLTSLGGSPITSAGLRGKSVVILFARQGQEKSLEAMKALAGLAKGGGGETEYLAVVTNPSEGDVGTWSQEVNSILTVMADHAGDMYGSYGILVTPSTGVLDSDGKFVGVVNGYTARYVGDVTQLVQKSLGLATEDAESGGDAGNKAEQKSEARKTAERSLEKAKLLQKRKMKDKAIIAAEEAVASDSEFAEARLYLAGLMLDVSDDNAAQALAHYEAVLAVDPRNADANVGLARVKSIQGDYDTAANILGKAVLLNPHPEKIFYELGKVYERAGNYEKAVEAYRSALEKVLD